MPNAAALARASLSVMIAGMTVAVTQGIAAVISASNCVIVGEQCSSTTIATFLPAACASVTASAIFDTAASNEVGPEPWRGRRMRSGS